MNSADSLSAHLLDSYHAARSPRGPFGQSIIVKVTDACPVAGNEVWCGQTATDDVNQFGQPFQSVFTHSFVSHGCTDLDYTSFDLCVDSGAAAPFFPDGMDAYSFH